MHVVGERIPANILLDSPWFIEHDIFSVSCANSILCDYLKNKNE